MFILNKKSNTIQECSNNDVIRTLKADTEKFAMSENRADLETMQAGEAIASEKVKEEAKEEDPEETQEGETEETEETEEDPEEETEGDQISSEEALMQKSVKELREIAKEKKIQGYANMDKSTLVAVIMAH